MIDVEIDSTAGFCPGVIRTIGSAERFLSEHPGSILYSLGAIVHNDSELERLGAMGLVQLDYEDLDEMPSAEGKTILVRAHGQPPQTFEKLRHLGFEIIDCTCPVVLRGQSLVRESEKPVLILGYKGHSEVDSLFGSAPHNAIVISEPEDLDGVEKGSYRAVVQTTFSISRMEKILEKAREKGIEIDKANSICLASVSRRNGVRRIADEVEAFVVVGSSHSANTRELVETASRLGKPSFLAEDCESIPDEVFSYGIIGLTAGASTPYEEYIKVKERLESYDNG